MNSISKDPWQSSMRDEVRYPPERTGRSTSLSVAPVNHRPYHGIDILEPTNDEPSSPGRLRSFSSRVKRNSATDKHVSEITTSSGSSSRLSATSDKNSWNRSMESLGLSRNPSQRSVSAAVPSHDRPDSAQFFSKGIFHRRGRLRRESSDQGGPNPTPNPNPNPNASQDTAEMPTDTAYPFMQSVFSRRRALRGEQSGLATSKKLQISGPYNFQHLTHTRKDSVPDLNRSNRMELVSEFSEMRPRRPSMESLQHEDSPFRNFSSESFFRQDDSAGLNSNGSQSRETRLQQPPPSPPSPKSRVNPIQSQNQGRPPRPPRSPTETDFGPPMQHPPPRTSSRISTRHKRFDSTATAVIDRPGSTTGFRRPQPFTPSSPNKLPVPPSPPRASSKSSLDQEMTTEPQQELLHAITTPDDEAWPLSNSISSLPDVPEEEEHHVPARVGRMMSVVSPSSSLRGSISAPLLRQMSIKHTSKRSPSNASDTLGIFGTSAHYASRGDIYEDCSFEETIYEGWEDDIDYCYEHEAEADCDFAWERPSYDATRGREMGGHRTSGTHTQTVFLSGRLSSGLLSPGSFFDLPALSPASQSSNGTRHEAITPTNMAVPVTSNFSLPRRESSAHHLRADSRAHSPECNFKEVQGFTISPSLLIPSDYHQQMIQYERDELEDSDNDEDLLIQGPLLNEGPILKFGNSLKPSNARSSASTTDSVYSEHSLTSSRHKSTNSTSTAYTRWTGSSTSSWHSTKPTSDNGHAANVSPAKVSVFPKFSDEAVSPQDSGREKHSRTQSHACLLMRATPDAVSAAESKPAKETIRTRGRARTTSRSHTAPQFALFPAVAAAPGGRV
ncbi:uncharacterized protein GGS25DRAFT_136733 [Hypoxylon fragiforme]|uniref:uncharacterized protein n=1 Tax=Hypoxylon fragiforme TaxID=63214 RepID=UPI0020C68642|nr:uncharacterized protein GGS25DRAFT_136733 [Hypoxylon fragiforme]KAI2612816.1 hypothetical protein GGS25DRAFT_136733 [Hypoxylon fragiforme]